MFSKLSTILQQAVDALAPDSSPIEDFVYHWKCITNFYVENTDDKCPVTSTNIPSHMQQMLVILTEEEAEREIGNTGPCMEYLLQHKLPETLHTLGRADCPPGMKQQVLRFFTSLLGRIQQPLLPHVNVHRPVSRLVRVCGEVPAAPTEQEEIAFLCTVCSRLKQEPHLAHLFLRSAELQEKPKNQKDSKSQPEEDKTSDEKGDNSSTTTDNKSETATLQKNPARQSGNRKDDRPLHSYTAKREGYDLVDSLLNLSKSEDGRVAVKACEGIMLLVSLKHKEAARAVVKDTALCYLLNLRLTALFSSLPPDMDPIDIDSIEAKWGLDARNPDSHRFVGKRALVSFLSWFDYIDRLTAEGIPNCREHIARHIRENFFEQTVAPLLCQENERTILTTTSILTKLFHSVGCQDLLHEMLNFLFFFSANKSHTLLLCLLERCDHLSDEISIANLQLFETILMKNDQLALDELVINYLNDRGYHVNNPGNIIIQTETEELEWDLEPGLEVSASTSPQRNANIIHGTSESDPHSPMEVAKFNPRLHIQQAVNCYLNVLPDAAKSSQSFNDDSGHDSYLREAHRMYRDVQIMCKHFNWPMEYKSPETCPAANTFCEGPFVKMLLMKISRVLDQPYEVNLVVTSIASRLCLVPNPLLQEYFADPLTPLGPNVQTLYNTLQKLVTELVTRISHIPNFKHRLLLARKTLIGNNDSPIRSISGSNPAPTMPGYSDRQEYSRLLEGAIVLEEFCKELAAILFVKHHASSAST